jgi:hypothetical protein
LRLWLGDKFFSSFFKPASSVPKMSAPIFRETISVGKPLRRSPGRIQLCATVIIKFRFARNQQQSDGAFFFGDERFGVRVETRERRMRDAVVRRSVKRGDDSAVDVKFV